MREEHALSFKTLPQILVHALEQHAGTAVLHSRCDGKWSAVDIRGLAERVALLSRALRGLGVGKGEAVGLLAAPSPDWLIFDLAILAAGGVSVPLFALMSRECLEFELRDSGMKTLIACGEELLAPAAPCLGGIERLIVKDARPPSGNALRYEDLMARAPPGPPTAAELSGPAAPGDLATIIYTSGSTGLPKGVELTHHNLVSQVQGALRLFPLDPARDRALSALPLAHIFERMVMYYYLASGLPVWIAEDPKKLGEVVRAVRPTIMTAVPRLLEKIAAHVEQTGAAGGPVKRALVRWAVGRARQREPGEAPDLGQKLADALVYGKIRASLGGCLRIVIAGGAALAPDLQRFFMNAGIPTYQGYGLTEASPVICANYPGHNRPGTVGPAFPGVELRLSDGGEILARGPGLMRGYRNNPAASAAALDSDGWLHTGDRGALSGDGFLTITGRIKELMKTSTGKYVSPVPIEEALGRCPLVETAMVIADGRRFATCLLFPNLAMLRRLKTEKAAAGASDAEFLAYACVRQEIESCLEQVNARLNHWEQVRKFRFAPEPPTVESGLITPTLKIRRSAVQERYRELIEDMYREEAV